MKIKVLHDVYNISKRVKSIDRDYYVVYDTSKQQFEIHNLSQVGSTYCLTIPHKQLDERVLKLVRKTQSANIDEILEQLENDNKHLESANESSAFSKMFETFEQNLSESNF